MKHLVINECHREERLPDRRSRAGSDVAIFSLNKKKCFNKKRLAMTMGKKIDYFLDSRFRGNDIDFRRTILKKINITEYNYGS